MVFFCAFVVIRYILTRKRNLRCIPKSNHRAKKTFIQRFTKIGIPDNTTVSRDELELGNHQYRSEELDRLVPASSGSTGTGRTRASEEGAAMIRVHETEETGLSEPPPAYFSQENGPAPPKYRNLV